MEILHAFWQPDPADDFARSGRFRLWVETDSLYKPPTTGKTQPPKAQVAKG